MKNLITAIDHFILGIKDLDRGMAEFEELTGIKPVFGGVHESVGTHNALVSLGKGTYLEILAPINKEGPTTNLFGHFDMDHLKVVGWVVRNENSEHLVSALDRAGVSHLGIRPLSRKTGDGKEIKWKNVFHHRDGVVSINPFFIEWEDLSLHPSETTPVGCSLKSFSVNSVEDNPLTSFLASLSINLVLGNEETLPPGRILDLQLNSPKGEVVFLS